jgi:two-component system, LytTR family, response regulator LytT
MKINTLIIDDSPDWRKIISKFVGMNPLLNLVDTCSSAMEAYGKLTEHDVDLLICDIEMPELSGLSFIRSLVHPPLVVFVTAHRDYALDCYEVSPIDFLMKPLDYERFMKAIEKVRQRLENAPETSPIEPYFFIRENRDYLQIRYKDVLYIKSHENVVHIVTADKTYQPILTMARLEEKLKGDIFLRVHRSFLIHRDAIATIGKNDIILRGGQEIPIGDQYRTKISHKHIETYSISR